MTSTDKGIRRARAVLAAALVGFTNLAVQHAAADEIDNEFEFASGLVDLGFPDFAQRIVDVMLIKRPDLADRANLVKAQSLIASRKFPDAEALLKTMGANPKADAVRLALANGYYAVGEIDKSKALYTDFFGKFKDLPQDPDLLRFYRDAAYTYGQLLEAAGDLAGAADSYGKVLRTSPEKDIERRIMADQAQLYLRIARTQSGGDREASLKKSAELCDKLQWGGVDLWFGQSIMIMANGERLRGNVAGAEKILKQYDDILTELDGILKEQGLLSQSPMSGVRFMRGELALAAAENIKDDAVRKDEAVGLYGKALGEFYNVFVKYGDSDWGPEAGLKANEIKTLLEQKYGKVVKIDLGSLQDKAVQTQFRLADNLYRQKKFNEAIPEYVKGLNLFPESTASVKALGSLAMSYAESGDDLGARMVSQYLADRFSASADAGNAVLILGKYYFDKKVETNYFNIYETYANGFPTHDKIGAILFTLGGLLKKAGNVAGANEYFQRLVDNYSKDAYYPKALTQLAWSYYQEGAYLKAADMFKKQVAEVPPGPDRARAQFDMAECFIRVTNYMAAVESYETLIGWLAQKDSPYSSTPAAAATNKVLLEKAVFSRANCYARAMEPADQIPAFREKALRGVDQFLAMFPESATAPRALKLKGGVQLELKQVDAASKTFDELAAKYPNTDEGKNALYSLASSALEVKQIDQARQAFEKMLQGNYKPDEYVRIGQLMLDNNVNDSAIKAFEQVTKTSQERALLERALYGIGSAHFANKDYEAAIKAVEELMTRYPKSGLFFDAKFILGRSYAETGKLDEALTAISDVLRFADLETLRNDASLNLAHIQEKKGDQVGALASLSRVAFLSDPSKPELRPSIEQAIMDSIRLGNQMKRYKDVEEACDLFLKQFPNSDKVEQVRKWRGEARLASTAAGP